MSVETHGPAAPGDGAYDDRLTGLVESLKRAKRRSDLRLFFDGLVTAIVIGLALFLLLQLLDVVLGGFAPIFSFEWLSVPAWFAEWRPAPIPQHLVVAIAGGVAALVVAQFSRFSGSGIGPMARRADREFALAERISTALELSRRGDRRIGVVGEALLRDAAQRTTEVDARRLTPMRLGLQALLLPVLAVAAILVVNNPPAQIVANGTNSPAAAQQALGAQTLTDVERAEAAGEIRAIAAILAQDGEARSDPVLQAVAAELAALGNEVAANPNIDRTALGDALDRLAGAANEVYAAAGLGETDNNNYAQLVDDALRAIDPGRYIVEPDERTADEADNTNVFDGGGVAGANVPMDDGIRAPQAANFDPEAVEVVEGAAVPDELRLEWDNPYEETSAADFAVNPEVEIIGLGEGVGGNLPGLGAAPLGGGDGEAVAPAPTEGEMLLVDPDPGNGRTIVLTLPPMEQLLPVNTDGLQTGGVWAPFAENEVNRTTVPATDLEAVGRYFQTITAEREE